MGEREGGAGVDGGATRRGVSGTQEVQPNQRAPLFRSETRVLAPSM